MVRSMQIGILVFAMLGCVRFSKFILSILITFTFKPEHQNYLTKGPSSSTNYTTMEKPKVTKAKVVRWSRKRTTTPQRNKPGAEVAPKWKWMSAEFFMENLRQVKLKMVIEDVRTKLKLAEMRTNRQPLMARKQFAASSLKHDRLDRLRRQVRLKQTELLETGEQTKKDVKLCNNLKMLLTNTKKQFTRTKRTVKRRVLRLNKVNQPETDCSTLFAVFHDVIVETPTTNEADRLQTEVISLVETPESLKAESLQSGSKTIQDEELFEQEEAKQNLDHPLSHYYIKGSHNTYLLGNQLTSASTIDGYRRAVANKCKCLELDLHDGPNGEPVIYHGWTLTSRIVAREVLEDGIKPNFNQDDLPLILVMDDHIKSIEQRQVFIKHLHDILGHFIYVGNTEEMACLPSPNQLRGKIIIHAPRAKWGDLANICQAVPFPPRALDKNPEIGKWFEASSLSEHQLNRLLKSSTIDKLMGNGRIAEMSQKRKMREITANRLIRYYPGGQRQLSGNFNPIPGMNAGCQIAAMNIQTKCSDLAIYESRFIHAGNCGYALKPEFLLDQTAPRISPKRIVIKVISGRNLPQTGKRIHTYVNIRVQGEKEDKTEKATRKVNDDGRNPKWEEELRFDVRVPELGFLLFQVKRSQYFGLKRACIASYAVPVVNLVNGPCSIPLHDENLVPLDKTYLLIQVTISDSSSA